MRTVTWRAIAMASALLWAATLTLAQDGIEMKDPLGYPGFSGDMDLDVRDSTPDWTPFVPKAAADGAPNILFVLYADIPQVEHRPCHVGGMVGIQGDGSCFHRTLGNMDQAFRLMMTKRKKWRKLDGRNRLPEVISGVEFRDGVRHIQVAF